LTAARYFRKVKAWVQFPYPTPLIKPMAADNIEKLEDAYRKMREATAPLDPIPDNRGPLVYDVTKEASLNGVDPNYKNKKGA
jgi:hypothetical protein